MSLMLDDPLLHGARAARPLVGLSGARVVLMTTNDHFWFVRKGSGDPAGNERLRRQVVKLRDFRARLADVVHVPEVLGDGEIDGRYYYDMEQVHGQDAAAFLRTAPYGDVAQVAARLVRYLSAAAERPSPGAAAEPASFFEATFAKICDVQRRTGHLSDAVLAQLLLGCERLRRQPSQRPTTCHGDLTLENLVVDPRGELWMLDLLDAPYEHYWQDIAKLHQDLAGGWYLRRQPPIARCVADYLSRRILEHAERLSPQYPGVHHLLVACTFVRILPYAAEPAVQDFLRERITYFAAQIPN